jgi:hypothetical protein
MGENCKICLKEIGCNHVDWTHTGQNMGRWRALVNTVMNLRFCKKEKKKKGILD